MVEPAFLLELGGVVLGLAVLARIAARWQLPGSGSDLGALAGAYVLILAASGPLIARVMNPLVRHRLESRGRERPLPR